MPGLVKTCIEIAKEYNQKILFVDFQTKTQRNNGSENYNKQARIDFINWLALNNIEWMISFPPLDSGWISFPYAGSLAIIASEKEQNDLYNLIVTTWENEDGSSKAVGTTLWIVDPDKFKTPEQSDI